MERNVMEGLSNRLKDKKYAFEIISFHTTIFATSNKFFFIKEVITNHITNHIRAKLPKNEKKNRFLRGRASLSTLLHAS